MLRRKSVFIFLSGLSASYLLNIWHGNDTSISVEGLYSNIFSIFIVLPYALIGFFMVLHDINYSINNINKNNLFWIKIVYNFIKLSLGVVSVSFAFIILYDEIISESQLDIYAIVVPIMLLYMGIHTIYNTHTYLKNRDHR